MDKKDKKLLLKDLCARLPYGVIIEGLNGSVKLSDYYSRIDITKARLYKPYLRPMSSMTDEEKEDIKNRWCVDWDMESPFDLFNYYEITIDDASDFVDWLNEHHFDYRGLINKGLALEAPKDMYKNELIWK